MADTNDSIKTLVPVSKSSNGTPLFECVCPDCGAVRIQDRRKIGTRCAPCGASARKTHGLSKSRIYKVWSGMVSRCKCPSVDMFKYYGGRGITVCQEWADSPHVFFEWAKENGYTDDLEIDRINPNGDYEPSNCRFISHQINSQLRRNAKCTVEKASEIKSMLASGGTVREVSEKTGVPYMSVWHIDKGNTWKNA